MSSRALNERVCLSGVKLMSSAEGRTGTQIEAATFASGHHILDDSSVGQLPEGCPSVQTRVPAHFNLHRPMCVPGTLYYKPGFRQCSTCTAPCVYRVPYDTSPGSSPGLTCTSPHLSRQRLVREGPLQRGQVVRADGHQRAAPADGAACPAGKVRY